MATYPKKDRRAKTGSNVPGEPLLAHRSELLAARQRAFGQLARDFQRETKKLFRRADIRAATEIVAEVNKEWRRASLTVGGDSAKVGAIKVSARRKLDRQLDRALPNYRKLLSLQREHSREYRKLVKTVTALPPGARSHIDWGDVLPTANPDVQEFAAPFPLFDAHTIDYGEIITRDESFVLPASGNLVNNIVIDVEDDTSAILAILGMYIPYSAVNLTSCGIPFTMPRAGRLQIGGVLRNFYNTISLSVQDCFGFSSADVGIYLLLFIDIVRQPADVIHLQDTLLSNGLGLVLHRGDDLSSTLSDLDITTPYTVSGVTEETFAEGEMVWIFVGSEVFFAGKLDDMKCHAEAVVWWQLKKITVEVVD